VRFSILYPLFTCALGLATCAAAAGDKYDPAAEGTFSIIGLDPATGDLGMAVHSKTVAVGSRTRSGKGGVAVVAHQSASNPMYGTLGIELIEHGMSPQEALEFMLRADPAPNRRQVAIIDIHGRTAAWTSPDISDWKGHKAGANYVAQGNTLAGPEVVEAMARSFESSSGPLAERLLAALEAGQAAGGDKRGVQSASLLVVRPLAVQGFGDRALDLRVDEHVSPFAELRRVLEAFRSREAMAAVSAKSNAGDFAGALTAAEAARDLSPTNDNAWVAIAEMHLRLGRIDPALEAVRRAVELNAANRARLREDADFEALHAHPEFLRVTDER
jgi:uncharacterized Ntn-hydrolase superfamily protein